MTIRVRLILALHLHLRLQLPMCRNRPSSRFIRCGPAGACVRLLPCWDCFVLLHYSPFSFGSMITTPLLNLPPALHDTGNSFPYLVPSRCPAGERAPLLNSGFDSSFGWDSPAFSLEAPGTAGTLVSMNNSHIPYRRTPFGAY